MSATDELRRMLNERGVEYRTHGTTDRTWFEVGHTSWFIFERENGNFTVDAVFLTPEQAIAATLGETDKDCYLMRDGKKFPVELDYGFLGIMPIAITVGGFRYLVEVSNEE